jgi:hypothetical protein
MKSLRHVLDPRVVLFSSCLILLAATSAAQMYYVGTLRLYCDSLFTCTKTTDTVPRIMKVYVVHDPEGGMYDLHYAATFMVAGGGGFTGTWVADACPYPNPTLIGSSPAGITIGYGTCAVPGHILTITYMLSGTSALDSYLEVLPDPAEQIGRIILAPCLGFLNYCDGGRLEMNPGVPSASTTWGRIKATYE